MLLVVLGIELDSVVQVARLPMDKLCALQELIQSWQDRHWCTKCKLDSLTGHLHHAAQVVWLGSTFLRCMINLLQLFCKRDHPIRLNCKFHLDLQWWLQFLSSWRSVYFWSFPSMSASLTSKSHLTRQVPLASVSTLMESGSVPHGFLKPLTL